MSSAPLVGAVQAAGDVIVAVDRQGQVVGVDRQGRARWKIATQNSPNENAAPVIVDGTLYFTGAKEFIVASARTGSVASRVPLDSSAAHLFGQRVAVSSGLGVYPTSSAIAVFDTATGATVRQVPVPGGALMTPAIADGRVFVVSQTGAFTVIDPSAGEVQFQVPTGASQPVASAVLLSGSRAFFGDRKGMIVCVDIDARQVAWKVPLKGAGPMGVFQDIVASADGRSLFVFASDAIFALSAADGSLLFEPLTGASTPPLSRDGKLYFGTIDKTLAVVDEATGKAVASLPMKAVLSTRPQPDGQRLVVGDRTGRVFVISPDAIK